MNHKPILSGYAAYVKNDWMLTESTQVFIIFTGRVFALWKVLHHKPPMELRPYWN
jgi:hypothetical protein